MELYELNYLNLRRLLPDPDALGEYSISALRDGLDLHYQLLERCKYTITFSLSYRFPGYNGIYMAPDLSIRLYQDALVAEVMSGVVYRRYMHRDDAQKQDLVSNRKHVTLTSRWRLNRFLFKWLRFCIKQGHQFKSDSRFMETTPRDTFHSAGYTRQ
jgi:uncharacterized protein YqiB (DUF1249 family)